MTTSSKQKTAIAAVILFGALAGAAVLFTGRIGGGAGHDSHDSHGETAGHAEPGRGDPQAAAKETRKDFVKLLPEQIAASGIVVATAEPANVQDVTSFPGEIKFNEDLTAHVVPRVAGVVESVPAQIGQQVAKGEVLAVIASPALAELRSESLAAQRRLELAQTLYQREKKLWEEKISAEQDYLQARNGLQEAEIALQNIGQKLNAIGAGGASRGLNRFELRAPFEGVIVEKHIALGEAVKEDASIFTLSDLRTVWAEFVMAPKDLSRVRVGQAATVTSTAFDGKASGRVSYIGSLLGQQTRTATARVTLANPDMAWRPGLFVTVVTEAERVLVPVAVQAAAIQTVDGQPSVFVAGNGGFTARPVRPGRSSGTHVEIVEGLRAGEHYAAANSFVIKSELGKSSADHAH